MRGPPRPSGFVAAAFVRPRTRLAKLTQGGNSMSLHNIKGLRARQTRRQLLRNATTALSGAAALTMAPAVLGAQSRAVKIGLVTPATGPLAAFAEADAFVVGQFKKTVAGGIKIGAQTYAVDVLVRDSRAGADFLFEALELRRSRSRNSKPWRLQADSHRRAVGHTGARRGWLDHGGREHLRASRRRVLPRALRQPQGIPV